MLIAHLPAGYCFGKIFRPKYRLEWIAVLAGSILPDLDMFFFHFVDNGKIHHHKYWVHIPFFWAVLAAITLPLVWRTKFKTAGVLFFAALLLHMFLDSIGGGIMWLAPFKTNLYSIVEVPATRSHWILSFIFHWTFWAELVIWACAIILFVKNRKQKHER